MNEGCILWEKSKKLIPGGNMLISKRPNLFAPKYWPTYYKKAKGCFVWDLENKKYPPILEQGKNLLLTIGRIYNTITDKNSDLVTPRKIYWQRIEICKSCPRCDQTQKRCLECGCFIPMKAKLVVEACPLGKWEENELID